MKNLILFSAFVLTINLQSCLKDDGNNPEYVRMEITDVEIPDTFRLGGTYEFRIHYDRPDGCTHLQGFDSYPVAQTTRQIVAIGVRYGDEPCPDVVKEETGQLLFQVIYSDTYTFRFWQGEDDEGNSIYLEKKVPVR